MKNITLTPSDDISSLLSKLEEPARVLLKSGVYDQKILLPPLVKYLSGEEGGGTVITNADYAKKTHADGLEYNTFRTYTLCVTGDDCTLENLTVINAAPSPEINGQCVALSVHAKSFYGKNLRLISTQDTLFCAPFPDDLVSRYLGLTPDPVSGRMIYYDGFIPRDQLCMQGGSRQVYENCELYGSVDFVFGGAEAYFSGCKIISVSDERGTGFVAAPCHGLQSERGFTFIGCEFLSEGAGDGTVFLARPWRDFGKCDFIDCTLGRHINPALYDNWNDSYRDKTARFSHRGLHGIDPRPVTWARELSEEAAEEIINTFTALKTKNRNIL